MPVKVDKLEQLLIETEYDQVETEFVVNGFRNGFPLGYQGNKNRKTTSRNLKFRCGTELILWQKNDERIETWSFRRSFQGDSF